MTVQSYTNDKVMVVGGYGDVGGKICQELSKYYPGKIIAAGRSCEKAKKFTQHLDGKIVPAVVDIQGRVAEEALREVRLVIMAVDLPNTNFVQQCMAHRISYIDITATYKLITSIKQLGSYARIQEVTGILSVGLAPGISNLLAKKCVSGLEEVEHIDIHILLGLGDDHGEASIGWILDNLPGSYRVKLKGKLTEIKSFHDKRETKFPGTLGKHVTYSFSFLDQFVIAETLKVPSVITRICFDRKLITSLLAFLAEMGFFKLLKYHQIKMIFKTILKKIKRGSDIYSIQVEAYGGQKGKRILSIASVTGHQEAKATAMVAAKTARLLLSNQLPSGVFHLHELYEINDFSNDLEDMEFEFDELLRG
uniref:Saccharopine dehydrogenase NADP-binding domain-containing protein n=1 Tax=Roseihalotalea indica TaxID=2867963 RepID=A0AA49GUH7_9BACT|nr:saccharopine dehydrogenase NADP-binding domain-containing protein [Tunicatimonas sp. TK19036]